MDIPKMVYLPVERLHPHPDNPRKDLGDLTELADSIKQNGILQNLTVVPNGGDFTVIIGHRRLAAAWKAGLAEVPCIIADMTPKEQMQTMLLENMQRSDLTVYEQAQGFQMMLSLGATVEEISERSGFSETTVRRRVKMTELDQDILKEVSSRQLQLGDFDTLAQIDDIGERNKALKTIGTSEFNYTVSSAIRKQRAKKNMPSVKKWLTEVGAQELPRSEKYSGKYEQYEKASYFIDIDKWGEGLHTPPKEIKKQVFYIMDGTTLRLYQKRERAVKEKKSEAQLEEERRVREAWEKLERASSDAYELRKAFVEKLSANSKNKAAVLRGAVAAGLLWVVAYNSPDRGAINEILGLTHPGYDPMREDKMARGYASLKDAQLPKLIYALFGDSNTKMCVGTGSRSDYPKYKENIKLTMLYEWLVTLGYEMSSEETALLDGEHEAYGEEADHEDA